MRDSISVIYQFQLNTSSCLIRSVQSFLQQTSSTDLIDKFPLTKRAVNQCIQKFEDKDKSCPCCNARIKEFVATPGFCSKFAGCRCPT